MDILTNLLLGFGIAFKPLYLLYALVGAVFGTITGILPGLGPIGAMSILLSFTLYLDATGAMILVLRDLLRGDVRGFQHVHIPEYPRRSRLGGHLHRRVPDGFEGQGRGSVDHIRSRFFHRRDHQHPRVDAGRPDAFRVRTPVWAPGIPCNRPERPDHPRSVERWILCQIDHHGVDRPGTDDRRDRPDQRRRTVYVRNLRAEPGDRPCARCHGPLRNSRSAFSCRGRRRKSGAGQCEAA